MAIVANIITYNVMSHFINDIKKFMIRNGTRKKLNLWPQMVDKSNHQEWNRR